MSPETTADDVAALKSQLAEAASTVLAEVPEHLRALIPMALPPAGQIAWFNEARAGGVFDKPAVPPTDAGARPAITPTTPETSSLPVHARMAAGYSN